MAEDIIAKIISAVNLNAPDFDKPKYCTLHIPRHALVAGKLPLHLLHTGIILRELSDKIRKQNSCDSKQSYMRKQYSHLESLFLTSVRDCLEIDGGLDIGINENGTVLTW